MVLHELAHIVDDRITVALLPVDDQEHLRELVQTPWDSWKSHTGTLRWAGHGGRYIRTLLHLHHRMASRGHQVDLLTAFSHESYGLSSIEAYRDAIGDEPSKNSWLPLAEVLAMPQPENFQKLWTADVLRSLKPVSSKGKK